MFKPLRLLRSWRKEERLTPLHPVRLFAVVCLVFCPVAAWHVLSRAKDVLTLRESVRDDSLALLEATLGDTDREVWDWGHWTDAYRFATGTNPNYIQANLKAAALFNNGSVMLMLGNNGSSLLEYSNPPLSSSSRAALIRCLKQNLQQLTSKTSKIRLACEDARGSLYLGSATPVTSSNLDTPTAGTLALLQPLPRRDDAPSMRRHLLNLQRQLVPLASKHGSDDAIQPPLRSSSGALMGLRRSSTTAALQEALQSDLPILLTIPLAAALLRAFSLLERRRQKLRERQLERHGNQRLRRTCRELDQLIDELLPSARQATSGTAATGASSLEATTSRFRTFLQSARQLALFDSLTRLPNRHYFIEHLHAVAARYQATRHHFAVLFIDIDKFKIINDSFGHTTGDGVLLNVCQRLAALVSDQDFLARYGGDELAMILDLSQLHDQSPTSLSAAARIRAQDMVEALQEPIIVESLSIPVSLSIGITLVDPDEPNLMGVIQRSDLAMYQAKRNRTDRIAGPEDVAQIPQLSSYQLFTDLMTAIENQQLQVFFQPIRNTAGHQTGVEALARWQHPQRGWIEPAVFLEIAEQHRQMQVLGEELIRLSLNGFQQLQSVDPELRLFLNLAPSQLTNPDLASSLLNAIRSHQLQGHQIVLELTENTLLEPLPPVVHNLEVLRDAGISLALDDFGTGYSSLVMLKSLSPDIVKIDKTFIQALGSDDRALHIIALIAELAPRLGIELVAEGIEDRSTLEKLVTLGIQCFQGYELGRPSLLVDLLTAPPAVPQPAASKRSMA